MKAGTCHYKSTGSRLHCVRAIAGMASVMMLYVSFCRTLARALPKAPQQQYQTIQDPVILHTTMARLLKPTKAREQKHARGRMLRTGEGSSELAALHSAVGRMTEALCGLRLTLRNLW